MRKQLNWTGGNPDTAVGDGTRVYRISQNGGGEWKVYVAATDDSPIVARGWARTTDGAKRIAEEWEHAFCQYEMPDSVAMNW